MTDPQRGDAKDSSRAFGAFRGGWPVAMLVIVVAVVAVVAVLVLIRMDVLDRWWGYVVLPIAIVAAAAARVLTIFKAKPETEPDRKPDDS